MPAPPHTGVARPLFGRGFATTGRLHHDPDVSRRNGARTLPVRATVSADDMECSQPSAPGVIADVRLSTCLAPWC